MSRVLGALWTIVMAVAAFVSLTNVTRGGHAVSVFLAVILPICLIAIIRSRIPAGRDAPVTAGMTEKAAGILRQLSKPDQDRVVSLIASGHAIEAIKVMRGSANINLRTAKDIVDRLAASNR